jgi:hypothetical protein
LLKRTPLLLSDNFTVTCDDIGDVTANGGAKDRLESYYKLVQ